MERTYKTLRTKQLFVLVGWFIFSATSLFAKTAEEKPGTIKGLVTTSDNKSAADVNVLIKDSHYATVTDENGAFEFQKLKAGNYTLQISLAGYETVEQIVTVEDNKTTVLSFQLQLSEKQLQEVIVTSSSNKFAKKESGNVARMPLKNLENPQVYSVVGKELMKEQIVIERSDLYRNVPGAVPNFLAGGSQGMSTRGFASTLGMRNGLITSSVYPMNTATLERLEVLKGPSGTLFGGNRNTTFGGVYNYIIKKPYNHFGGELSYTAGSFELFKITADINTPVNEEKTALFRLNAAWQSENSFQDQGYAKNYTFAPTFSYQVNNRLKFLIDIEIIRSAYTTTSSAIGSLSNVRARNFKDLKLGYKRSFINNSIDIKNGVNNMGAEIEYRLSDTWKSETKFLYSEGFYDHFFWTNLSMLTDSTVMRSVRNQPTETFGNIQLQQNFIGDFKIGPLRNRMVIGADYSKNYNSLNRTTITYDTININQPLKDFTVDKINELSTKRGFTATTFSSNAYGLYASDVINLTPELMAMISLRLDRYSTQGEYTVSTGTYRGAYEQTALSPKLGIVYQPLKEKVSLFANYMNGFVNLAPVTQPDNTILELEPQYADQWEAGVKLNIIQNKLNGSVSYYDISVTNSTRTEVINGQNFTVQDGTQNSKGFEAELIGNPIPGLNIIAGYAYNDNKYTKSSEALKGKSLVASPQHVANLWVSYYITKGKYKGIGIGAGGNYISDSWFESTNVFVLPAYTLLSATLFYDQPKYRIGLKANNLLDEHYWNSGGTPQKPFNLLANFTLKL